MSMINEMEENIGKKQITHIREEFTGDNIKTRYFIYVTENFSINENTVQLENSKIIINESMTYLINEAWEFKKEDILFDIDFDLKSNDIRRIRYSIDKNNKMCEIIPMLFLCMKYKDNDINNANFELVIGHINVDKVINMLPESVWISNRTRIENIIALLKGINEINEQLIKKHNEKQNEQNIFLNFLEFKTVMENLQETYNKYMKLQIGDYLLIKPVLMLHGADIYIQIKDKGEREKIILNTARQLTKELNKKLNQCYIYHQSRTKRD